ncbi:MAG: type II toxin-antitoxin system RelE/ParE family toxin [Alphaproteobacteria bacterium]
MIRRRVTLSAAALADIKSISDWVSERGGPSTARRYVDRLFASIDRMSAGALRGTPRDDIRPGLRIVGFERNLTIAFRVTADEVEVVRIFRRGRNWSSDLSETPSS